MTDSSRASWLLDLRLHRLHQLLGVGPAALDQVVDRARRLLPAELARLHQVLHDPLGLVTGDAGELRAGVHVLLQWVAGHARKRYADPLLLAKAERE